MFSISRLQNFNIIFSPPDSSRHFCCMAEALICYKFSRFSGFVVLSRAFVLQTQKELEKNKICLEYLLLEITPNPQSLWVSASIIRPKRHNEDMSISQSGAPSALIL